jgi:5-methylcytosine-specific restriction enzyme A
MKRIEDIQQGDVINNHTLCEIFGCGPQGGMRRSHKTGTLVIVSNHIKSIYDDRWLGDTFHYTGMGTKGDQSLAFMQNKTLAESNRNGVKTHLFEVFEDKNYTYIGEMTLIAAPYFEEQPDELGYLRQACVFPLKVISGEKPFISKAIAEKPFLDKQKKARRLSDKEIADRAKSGRRKPGTRQVVSQQYERDPWVVEHAKRLANGICQLCEQPAPFSNKKGDAYLETHHIQWLAKGGSDSVDNTVALCPNCHRKMHVLNDKKDIKFLKEKVAALASIG